MTKLYACIILVFSFNFTAVACDWIPKEQKVSEFVSGKTIFWGRAVQAKWDRQNNNNRNVFEPYVYNVVEVIKPIKGKVGKTVKVWDDPSSCRGYISLGHVQLFIVKPYPNNSFYTNQLISQGASEPAIIAYFNDGVDISVKGSFHAPYLTEKEIKTQCQKSSTSELPDFCIPKDTLNKIFETYENENEIVKELANKKPWWHFRKTP